MARWAWLDLQGVARMYRIALSRRKGGQESSAPGDRKAGPGPKVKTRIAQAVDIRGRR